MNSLVAHFGIGANNAIGILLMEWASGTINVIENPNINETIIVEERSTVLSPNDPAIDAINLYPNPT